MSTAAAFRIRTRRRRHRTEEHNDNNNNNTRMHQKWHQPNQLAKLGSLSLIIILSAALSQLNPLARASVIRPTVFSDLNTSQQQQQDNNAVQQASNSAQASASPPASIQVQQTQSQQQQQQQQLQQSQQSNLNTLSAAPAADASQIVHASQQQQQQHSATKISPIKSRFCHGSNQQRLDQPLGLQSYNIDDLAISSSSSSNEQVKPHLARLNLDIRGGAWCPANPVHAGNFGKEWIQVKLNRSHVITAIETQGRFGMGNGKEFVPSYQIEYSRNAGRTWHKWKDIRGSNLLRANEDPNSAVKNELSPPIVGANVIRILPYSSVPRTVCMRLELHGCLFDEGAPIAYATQDGVVEPRWGHLIDYTYDGLRMPSGELSHGLGQLVDGVKGLDNFGFNNGFEWVGWKSMNGDVVIEFTFRTLRNFTGALFHSNNLFSSGVEVFQAVDVHYGIDIPNSIEALKDSLHEQQRRQQTKPSPTSGSVINEQQQQVMKHTLWSPDVLSIEYEQDKKSESSRPVTVHLNQRLANKLKFVLKFASKWILVSEVEFLSHPVELLSLASLSQSLTPQLMAHLQPAKSYDEYVAILREHQLRRLAAETLIFHSPAPQQPPAEVAAGEPQPSYPAAPATAEQQQPTNSDQSSAATEPANAEDQLLGLSGGQLLSHKRLSTMAGQQQQQQQWPVTNPLLNPSLFAHHPAIYGSAPGQVDSTSEPYKNQLLLGEQNQRQQQQSTTSSSPIGLLTVISFVLVIVVLFVGLLFVISSYRMRQQSSSKLARHLSAGGIGGGPMIMGKQMGNNLMGPSLHNFMSVFSSPPAASAANQQQQQQRMGEHHHYNAIFGSQTTQRRHQHQGQPASSALKRLATLGHSSTGKHLMGGGGGQSPSSATNQLLVSVKDVSSSSSSSAAGGGTLLFGGGGGPPKQPAMSTQLIIGLNQPPLPAANIYNQLNYANHYSTSMSMASSSTNGGQQGDYGDYAIPDAVPIIPPPSSQHQHQMHQLLQHQQRHQPPHQAFVSRLTQDGQQVRSSLINTGTTNHQHLSQQQQQQPQLQHQIQHNYEPV